MPSPEQRRDEFDVFVADVWEKLPKLEDANEKFSTSFEDMTRRVAGAVEGLVGAIKGGGFFDILDGVIELFGTLSSTGIFGKKMQSVFSGGGGFGGFRADGGPVAAGKAYVVGERGPELFMPKMAGSVLPNMSGIARVSVGGAGAGAGRGKPERVDIRLHVTEEPGFASKVQYAATGAAVSVNRDTMTQAARRGRQRLAQ